ncbi:MAG TPA: hypothetical protein QGH10_10850 [Armatimonadota bacterium]|nr:hypothetical protein [Armatimonadota bacterium]
MATSGATDETIRLAEGTTHWREEAFGFVLYDAVTDTLYEGNKEGSGILKLLSDGAPQMHVVTSLGQDPEDVAEFLEPLIAAGVVVET